MGVDFLEFVVLGAQHLHVLKGGTLLFLTRKALVLLGKSIDGLLEFFYLSLSLQVFFLETLAIFLGDAVQSFEERLLFIL